MWAMWMAIVGASVISFYALLPDSHMLTTPPDMCAQLAGDMAAYRAMLETYVQAHPTASGYVPESNFIQAPDWSFSSQRWQNYVSNGTVVVYPAQQGVVALPLGFTGAMLEQAGYSVEAGLAENGQIVNPLNSEGNVTLPGGMPAISNGTPVWLAQSF